MQPCAIALMPQLLRQQTAHAALLKPRKFITPDSAMDYLIRHCQNFIDRQKNDIGGGPLRRRGLLAIRAQWGGVLAQRLAAAGPGA